MTINSSSDGGEEIGFSLQDVARQDLLNAYWKVRKHQKTLIEEEVKYVGFIKVKSALDALNDLYVFVDENELKNKLYYKRKELESFSKFTNFYFKPYLSLINSYKVKNLQKMPVGNFNYHFRRWKKLCRLLVEVSGVTKFERAKELSSELAFAAGAN